jgi:hypothetical protein
MKHKSVEEETKKKIAKKLITPNRKYFVAGVGPIEAVSVEEVQQDLKANKEEVGDGNS